MMARSLSQIVESQINKAIAEGQFEKLDGAGLPLPDRSGMAYTDMATQVAVRIMAESGTLPEEFQIKKLLEPAREAYRNARSEEEERVAMALIAELDQRYNTAVEARRRFMRG